METKNLTTNIFPEIVGPVNGVVTLVTDSTSIPRIELYLQGEGSLVPL